MEIFYNAGVVNGKAGNNFDPKGFSTRAELATLLYQFFLAAE